jgi:hypothetical protein
LSWPHKSGDSADNRAEHLLSQFRVDGQGQRLRGRRLAAREISHPVTPIGETLLQVQRDRVVDLAPDVALLEVGHQLITPGNADDELVVDVPPIAGVMGQYDAGASIQATCVFADKTGCAEEAAIRRRVALARRGPPVQVLQFDAQYGCLERVQAEIAADYFVVVFRASPMAAQ